VISTNTVDRTAITAQIGAVFGSTKIPVPNYSGNPASTGETASTSAAEKLIQKQEKIKDLDARIAAIMAEAKAVRTQFDSAAEAYNEAKNNLPAGDPAIEEALTKAKNLAEDLKEIRKRGYAILDEKYKFISSPTA
jgi:chromosome segregation ATPase